MKRSFIAAVVILFLLSGCLSFKAIEYRITFDKKFEIGKIVITYENIGSDKFVSVKTDTAMSSVEKQEILQDRHDDFIDLVHMTQDDEQLLNGIKQGIYFKKRYLFEKDNALNGRYEGIFTNLRFDNKEESLRILKDEIFLTLKKDEDIERIETNGQLNQTENIITISWPKTEKTIYWRQILKENSETVSLLDEYRQWKTKKKL